MSTIHYKHSMLAICLCMASAGVFSSQTPVPHAGQAVTKLTAVKTTSGAVRNPAISSNVPVTKSSIAPAVVAPAVVAPAVPASATPPVSAAPVSTVDVRALDDSIAGLKEQIDAIDQRMKVAADQSHSDKSNQMVSIWIMATLLMMALLALGAGAYLRHQFKRNRLESSKHVITMPLNELIDLQRDQTFILLERLALHGHKETALYQTMCRSLSGLEQESGRSNINFKAIIKDVALADTPHTMKSTSIALDQVGSERLHSSAVANALKGAFNGGQRECPV